MAENNKWIVSPWFDLLFFANCYWLLTLLPGFVIDSEKSVLEFWQVYFLSSPHRWITLYLVAVDPDRRENRQWLFLSFAMLTAMIVTAVGFYPQFVPCLMLIDYCWNAWHFGAQHAGILRIYSRKTGQATPQGETWALRILITYTSLRLAGWTTGWLQPPPEASSLDLMLILYLLDFCVALVPISLWLRELATHRLKHLGKLIYFTSVLILYLAQLLCLNHIFTYHTILTGLVVAAAMFHAVEYLAIVSYYAERRQREGSSTLFQTMAKHWFQIIITFVLFWGTLSFLSNSYFKFYALLANLWAAYMHYFLDGFIWKLRKKKTAQTLGVHLKSSS